MGWEYQTKKVSLDGADFIYADADIGYNDGSGVLTQRSSLKLGDTKPLFRLPLRQIRGAVAFRDDFNYLNTNNWKREVSMYGGYNGEFQVYTNDPQNAYTQNGNLYIKPTFTVQDSRFDENFLHHGIMDMKAIFGECTNNNNYGCHREGKYGLLPPVMSARMKSVPAIKFGTVEVRARIPKGDWLWPAIWMLPKDSNYGVWPRSGEIDIMESRGNAGSIGVGHVSSTLHWGPDAGQNRFSKTTGSKYAGAWDDNFHTWRLEWTPTHLVTYIDNQQIMYVDPGSNFWNFGGFGGGNIWGSGGKMAPFDKEFYMILNVAVGGTSGFFSDNMPNKPWQNGVAPAVDNFWKGRNSWQSSWNGDKVAMLIDYIEMRYW